MRLIAFCAFEKYHIVNGTLTPPQNRTSVKRVRAPVVNLQRGVRERVGRSGMRVSVTVTACVGTLLSSITNVPVKLLDDLRRLCVVPRHEQTPYTALQHGNAGGHDIYKLSLQSEASYIRQACASVGNYRKQLTIPSVVNYQMQIEGPRLLYRLSFEASIR